MKFRRIDDFSALLKLTALANLRRRLMKSETAAFPSVVAAKKVAVSQLGYYRDMMGVASEAKKVVKRSAPAAKAKLAGKPSAK